MDDAGQPCAAASTVAADHGRRGMTARLLPGLLLGALLSAALALGITKVEDSDAWMHLALGRELVQHWGFPPSEPFTFPSAGSPYYNLEWLFDVVLYLAYLAGGFAGVILLKAALIALVFLVLWKDAGLAANRVAGGVLDAAIRTAVLLPLLVMVRHRIVERPDLVLMLGLSFTIYALNAYLYQGRRYLYVLPLVQVLWVNMHPSVVVGAVPFVAILAGGLILRGLERWRGAALPATPTAAQLKTVAIVFAAVILASLVNPYGPEPLKLPFQFAAASWHAANILELQPPRLGSHPGPFLVTAVLAATLLAPARRYQFISTLLVAPFVYLGLSGLRFVPLLMIVAAPVLARSFSVMAAGVRSAWGRRAALAFASTASALAFTAVGLAVGTRIEPFADARKIPGFGVNDLFLPEAALRYLDNVGVQGRVFNKYHWGGYIAWRDHPRRLAIIDGRGHLPPRLLAAIELAPTNPDLLDRLQDEYRFDVVITPYPLIIGDVSTVNALPSRARWALVYWDDVALIYLRRSAEFTAIIGRDEYHHVKPAYGVGYLRQALADAKALPALLAESRRNVAATSSSIGYTFLGFALLQAGERDRAIEAFGRVHGYSTVWDAQQGLAFAYWQKGDLGQAIERYRHVLRFFDDPLLRFNLGLALAKRGDDREAVDHLERVRAKAPWFTAVYPVLIEAYLRLGEAHRERELQTAYESARTRARAAQHVRDALRLEQQGRPGDAIVELRSAIALDPRNPEVFSTLGDVYLRQGRLEEARAQHDAALTLDPRLARAHYGLALAHRRLGAPADARRHLEAYVRLEPRSYLAWKARDELGWSW